jgi:hypothetical protein
MTQYYFHCDEHDIITNGKHDNARNENKNVCKYNIICIIYIYIYIYIYIIYNNNNKNIRIRQ